MISINKIKNDIKPVNYNYLSEEEITQLEKYKNIAVFWEALSEKDNIGLIGIIKNNDISEIMFLSVSEEYKEERIEIKLLEEVIENSKNNNNRALLIKIYKENRELIEVLESCRFIIDSNKNKTGKYLDNEKDPLLLKYVIYEEKELKKRINEYWQRFINSYPEYENKEYEVWNFCYGEYLPNKLLKLVKEGKKRATSSALELFETTEIDEKIPEEGDISIITYGNGLPGCILKTENIKHKKFREITEEEARLEGEGDLSLKYWQEAHRYFFQLEYEEMGKEFNEDIIVIFEEFNVIYDEDKIK